MNQVDRMLAEMRQEHEELGATIRVLERRTGHRGHVTALSDVEVAMRAAAEHANRTNGRTFKPHRAKKGAKKKRKKGKKAPWLGIPQPKEGHRGGDYALRAVEGARHPIGSAEILARMQSDGWKTTGVAKNVLGQTLLSLVERKKLKTFGNRRSPEGQKWGLPDWKE